MGQRPKPESESGPSLLLLFGVQGVLAQARAVLHELQLFAAGLPPERVVVVAGLVAHEKHGLDLFLALCHGLVPVEISRPTAGRAHRSLAAEPRIVPQSGG